ncbi:hypothetical protein T4B_2403 [Trichinella pseudospiralis]|uniref:Uncharacterized protein n=1 Tax=Trichinella pseudospiralis TaxID=6337 RepID=A0A0V1H010_TRIPS|nr:hypothetical protein T4A_8306 [Trichinella pseudospiralis]KRZ03902.1 hypothetical protein T4B_10963 [Trichinella pseudospiralis]KRZ05640.1 hypothetical protein T4B_2403 [Trichinella pseudospiralis]KRZ25123.1 hypothetical protein T4C_272 [Trichinella pseudospiralis]
MCRAAAAAAGCVCAVSAQIRRDYPLNLSISISGGKETKTNSPSSGERNEKSPYTEVGEQCCSSTFVGSLDWGFRAGAGPITNGLLCMVSRRFVESGCLRLQPKAGGKSHPRLNIRTRPIANKYREGKLKRTLKREFNRT